MNTDSIFAKLPNNDADSIFAKLPDNETNGNVNENSETSSNSLGAFDNIVNDTKKLNPVIREETKPKRGRPPKNMIGSNNKSNKQKASGVKDNKEEELILHLPLYGNGISKSDSDGENENNSNTEIIVINKTKQGQNTIANHHLFDKADMISSDEIIDKKKILDEIAKRDNIIKGLTEQLENIKHLMPKLFPSSNVETKIFS